MSIIFYSTPSSYSNLAVPFPPSPPLPIAYLYLSNLTPLKQTEHHLSNYKGYTRIPENSNNISKEIVGNFGDPCNNLTEPGRKQNSTNMALFLLPDTKSYQKTISGPEKDHWINTISQDLNNMSLPEFWTPAPAPKHINPLSTTWILKKNTNENGKLTKLKARLCVRGFNQN
ncbi:hypothetical protein O181_036425 [Austropuccinia psidii MF-1]|uniref:Reverse transcriptase Ty1/copia-type domain-containing protein n=1 Tax=Austropuccinia psidii MF-1 TaxID=1389203 RepID=A0A9Q3D6J2_9BASI|nr:hypothetical protein [Austropuccinia psidii MF-1]